MKESNNNIVLLALISVMFMFVQATTPLKTGEKGMRDAIAEYEETCMAHTLSEESKLLLEDNEEADNPEIRCFWSCIIESLKLKKGSEFYLPQMASFIDDYFDADLAVELKNVAKICYDENVRGENPCEDSGLFAKCIFDKKKTVID